MAGKQLSKSTEKGTSTSCALGERSAGKRAGRYHCVSIADEADANTHARFGALIFEWATKRTSPPSPTPTWLSSEQCAPCSASIALQIPYSRFRTRRRIRRRCRDQIVQRIRGYGDFFLLLPRDRRRRRHRCRTEVSLWDLATLDVLVREAGGAITDLDGGAVAINGLPHEDVLTRLRYQQNVVPVLTRCTVNEPVSEP